MPRRSRLAPGTCRGCGVPELRTEVLAEIRRVFRDELETSRPVEPQHELRRDLEVDSMGAMILAVALEDRFRVKLSDGDAGAVVTVEDLIALVERTALEARAERRSQPDRGEALP
jgi:acyl carrier protein